jgi:hypothetical protein
MAKQFAGTVLVNGNARRLRIESNPMGRTVIQVDGATVYDEKPFIQKDTISFDIVSGRKAMLRLQQVSFTGTECDVTVDGKTTTLTSVAKDGTVAKPVNSKQRELFKVRTFGASAIGLGVGSLILNYFELKDGSYYPKYLAIAPALIVIGAIALANPNLDLTSPKKRNAYIVFVIALLVAGWFFKGWFVSTFGPQ